MLKAIKLRIYPDDIQTDYINRLVWSCRFVYNQVLNHKISQYKEHGRSVSFGEAGKFLLGLKQEHGWLKESHSKVLQQSLINLEKAYKGFFKDGRGFPRFKSRKDSKQSCRFPSDAMMSIKGNRISVIKALKDIHFKCSRKDEIYLNKHFEQAKSATLTKTKSGKFYLSVLIDRPTCQPPKSKSVVGIDMGISHFVVASDGQVFDNIRIRRSNQLRIRMLNRRLSRKVKVSKNREKARVKLARFHERLNNIKENYLHKVANTLLSENQAVVIEDLNVAGMVKNHKLARSIQELSIYRFRQILEYKAAWQGKEVIKVGRFFPSTKLCSACGHKNDGLTLSDRDWSCPACGVHHDRDVNAAKNILAEGIKSRAEFARIDALGDSVRPHLAAVAEQGKECEMA